MSKLLDRLANHDINYQGKGAGKKKLMDIIKQSLEQRKKKKK